MVGVVLCTHGTLADALLNTTELILGELERVETVGLNPGDSFELLFTKLQDAMEKVGDGEGVLVLVDLQGGTPSNNAILLMEGRKDVEVVSGVNLPMLLEMFNMRSVLDVHELASLAEKSGKMGVSSLRSLIEKEEG